MDEENKEPTDEEVLEFYKKLIKCLNNMSKGEIDSFLERKNRG